MFPQAGVGSKDAQSLPSRGHMDHMTSKVSMENRKNGFFFVGIHIISVLSMLNSACLVGCIFGKPECTQLNTHNRCFHAILMRYKVKKRTTGTPQRVQHECSYDVFSIFGG